MKKTFKNIFMEILTIEDNDIVLYTSFMGDQVMNYDGYNWFGEEEE